MTKGAKMQKKPLSHKRRARKPARRRAQAGSRRWSSRVTATSDALDLEEGVFKQRNPAAIAQSLRRSAIASRRRKSDPYRSAMSMLVFYVNRAGSNLSPAQRRKLEAAKGELRKLFGRRARG
ncbi:MAG: DUF3175 domain-containing protein [Xanthobacteraceae bacterium]|nr:DUF3175 domain-containing protein [Xanthobacteraceae bacterium]